MNCPNCGIDESWIEDGEWAGYKRCGNCWYEFKAEEAPKEEAESGLIVREKDEATKNLEANIAKNTAEWEDRKAEIAAMSPDELAAHRAKLAEKTDYPDDSIWTR